MKRFFDIVVSLIILFVLSPILLTTMLLIFLYDFHSPFYIPFRVGKNAKPFKMVKFRTMIINADQNKIDTTISKDPRLTSIGKLIRRFKLDELPQLINVLKGDMSLVGPRPNIKRETALYTDAEKKLLTVKPGITDFSSITFSDLGEILKNSEDANIAYNQLIRPWKSRLGLLYIQHASFQLDIKICFITAMAIISPKLARNWLAKLLSKFQVDTELLNIVQRKKVLYPSPPPGAFEIVSKR